MLRNVMGWLGLVAYVLLTALLAAFSRLNFEQSTHLWLLTTQPYLYSLFW